MTRAFNSKIRCTRCGEEFTQETEFERWMRNEKDLRSELGLVRFDIDMLLHKYMWKTNRFGYDRAIQCLMFIEVKTHNAVCTKAQSDTLHMLNQILRNRRSNIHSEKQGAHLGDHTPLGSAYSIMCGSKIKLRMFGGHLLQFSGTDPTNSSEIRWDGKQVTIGELKDLLRFIRDPDNPNKFISFRCRSGPQVREETILDLIKKGDSVL